MFKFLKESLRNQLLSLFIFIGLLPFVTLLTYTLFLSESRMVDKVIIEQTNRAEVVIELIDSHIHALGKEVEFLASLDVMDDLLAEDIDKRVSRLLSKKIEDLNLSATLLATLEDGTIIASSDKNTLSKKIAIRNSDKKQSIYIIDKELIFCSKIYASFQTDKLLGYLVLKYNLDNIDRYLTHKGSIHSYIINPKMHLTIGEELSLKIDFAQQTNSLINSEYVLVYEHLSSVLKNWYIVYAVDKDIALEFLYDFIHFMLSISLFIFIFIIYISLKQSKKIVKPIENLTQVTQNVIETKNYSLQLQVNSENEIATLTQSFNNMLQTTSSALNKLEEENKLRLKRFTQLIEVFNTIIQTKDESECIEVSINEIKKLTQQTDLSFQQEILFPEEKQHIKVYVTDFENEQKVYFGSIELDIHTFQDIYEKNFYMSIASMISLQLDKIRLIQRTMSASHAKSAFISNMSHELRTPLNAIIGFAQFMLVYEELNEDQQDTVGNIESSAQYLLSMINEILDIAKIEAGKMEVHLEQANILELLQSSYNMLSPLADEKNLNFTFVHNDFHPNNFLTDAKMFQQIVLNLISNAIKFTQKGDIALKLYEDETKIYVSIKDSGIGIEENDLKKLFNDFTQVENVMQKKHKGTGLGLSLSKKMAKLLNGDVYLESDGLGKGTKSIFFIHKHS